MARAAAITLILHLSLMGPGIAQTGGTGDAPNEAKAAIRALIERTEATNNVGDVEGWVALFTDDAVYMPPNAPAVTSRDGLIEVARAGFSNRASIDIEPAEIEVCGDWAFARSTVTGTVTLRDSGEVIPIDLKQIAIYRRMGEDGWKIARMIGNSNNS